MNKEEMYEYDIKYTKQKLNEYLKKGVEPELCVKINGNEYMIIPLKDKISFQWIGKTDESYFNSVEELFSAKLVNGVILNNDWQIIEDIYYY